MEWRRAAGPGPRATLSRRRCAFRRPNSIGRASLNTEVRDLIEHNIRFSRQWWGDVQAQIASNITAERRLQALIRKIRIGRGAEQFQAAIDYSRRRFLKAMEAMPNTSVDAQATSTWRTTGLVTVPIGCK